MIFSGGYVVRDEFSLRRIKIERATRTDSTSTTPITTQEMNSSRSAADDLLALACVPGLLVAEGCKDAVARSCSSVGRLYRVAVGLYCTVQPTF
jgi:hypothetical protein